jgi:uncharacterized protein YggE
MRKLFLASLILCSLSLVFDAHAETETHSEESLLYVQGNAQVYLEPDFAKVIVGVEVQKETAQTAQKQANKAMSAFLKKLKTKGIKEQEIQTQQISVEAVHDYQNHRRAPYPVIGYKAVQKTEIKVIGKNRFELISQAIDLALAEKLNYIDNIHFGLSPELRAQTHIKLTQIAAQNALKEGKEILNSLNVRFIKIKEIHLPAAPQLIHTRRFQAAAMKNEVADIVSSTPIEGGELEMQVNINMVLEFAG